MYMTGSICRWEVEESLAAPSLEGGPFAPLVFSDALSDEFPPNTKDVTGASGAGAAAPWPEGLAALLTALGGIGQGVAVSGCEVAASENIQAGLIALTYEGGTIGVLKKDLRRLEVL